MSSTDRVTLDLREHEATQDRRQQSYDGYECEAIFNVSEKLSAEGMEALEITALLLTGEGQDLVEAEVTRLEEIAADAHVDAKIDAHRERNR